ncbi:hypothetical protein [Mannheimia varigena]|uniref:hypothetical protein n=1 Tax=Mannheimia varigena TaxID=85404 RepID=UPI0015B47452|nr:hypothetical protein [Mannheimia varigena]QLD33199.1 hypothetical protein A6B42_05200 [Mannheimia varigena]
MNIGNVEMGRIALVSDKSVSIKKGNLSDEDKELIKQAVLEHSRSYGGKGTLGLAKELKEAFILINSGIV